VGIVENRTPGDSAVGGFPDAAARRTQVISFGITGNSGNGGDAPAAVRSDQPRKVLSFGPRRVPEPGVRTKQERRITAKGMANVRRGEKRPVAEVKAVSPGKREVTCTACRTSREKK
jgi:hypothetical protein